jgi:hypothetical protein
MVKFWQNIKQYFYKRALAEATGKQKPTRSITNIRDAKTVGIIYDSRDAANDATIAQYAEQLRKLGKQVEILGYVSDKKTESKPGIQVLHSKNTSWTGVPADAAAEAFAAKNFDLLLACFIGSNPALEYIAATSKAKWRVGVYSKEKTELYELMVNMGDKTDLAYLTTQMTYFLNQINYDSN